MTIDQQHWRVLERTRLSVRDPHDPPKAAARERAARFREVTAPEHESRSPHPLA